MTGAGRPIVIGTRGSDLALWQARTAAKRIGGACEIRVVKTSGDRFLDVPLQGRIEKGFFTKEIEALLIEGGIDVAVHSLKDLPTEPPPGLGIGALLERAPVADLLLVHPDAHAPDHPFPIRPGTAVGATSLRRQALLAAFAPDTEPAFLRGNVPTRVGRCRAGEFGAIILARAGVERLGLDLAPLHVYELDPLRWLPAPGQGAVALQVRMEDERVRTALAAVDHAPTRRAIEIERALLANFEGGCHTAFGALAIASGTGADEAWDVHVGLERAGEGWVRTRFGGDAAHCRAQGPDTLDGFAPPGGEEVESLCRPVGS